MNQEDKITRIMAHCDATIEIFDGNTQLDAKDEAIRNLSKALRITLTKLMLDSFGNQEVLQLICDCFDSNAWKIKHHYAD